MKRADPKPTKMEKVLSVETLPISNAEARFLVSDYYQSQEMRKRADMQIRHLGDKNKEAGIPERDPDDPVLTTVLQRTANAFAVNEEAVKRDLQRYAELSPVGRWSLAQYGLGPVITAGLLAYINIERAPSVSHIWRYAKLDPTLVWEKGQKIPYNPELHQLCWHLGQCIKRTSGSEKSFYGKIYRHRKQYVIEKNERGDNAERAKNFRTNSEAVRKTLEKGKLPDGNLDQQACNYAAKMFLSHLHAVMIWDKWKRLPPKPYALAFLNHVHMIPIPKLSDFFPDLQSEMIREWGYITMPDYLEGDGSVTI